MQSPSPGKAESKKIGAVENKVVEVNIETPAFEKAAEVEVAQAPTRNVAKRLSNTEAVATQDRDAQPYRNHVTIGEVPEDDAEKVEEEAPTTF